MSLGRDHVKAVEESRRFLAALSPKANLSVAAFLRDFAPRLPDRQQRLADDMARRFEERARSGQPSRASSGTR